MATVTRRFLAKAQIAAYRRDAYFAVPHVIEAAHLAELRAVTRGAGDP